MLRGYFTSDYTELSFSRNEICIIWLITLFAILLRVIYQYERPYFGDEIGTLIHIRQPLSYIFTHAETWLTMHYFIAMEKGVSVLFGNNPFVLGFIPLLASVITVPVTAYLALRVTNTKTALIAAFLVASNPYLIKYSGIIRSYSLLTLMSILTIILFFRWDSDRNFKNGIITAVSTFFLCLCHPIGVYTFTYIGLLFCLDRIINWRKGMKMKSEISLLLPLVVSLFMVAIAYAPFFSKMLESGAQWHDIPPTDISYFPKLFRYYFSDGFLLTLTIFYLLFSIWRACREDEPIQILLLFVIMSVCLISFQGISHFPWAYARILIFLVPILIIMCAHGIWSLSNLFNGSKNRAIYTGIMTLALVISWIPHTIDIYKKKYDLPWTELATYLKKNVSENDIVVGMSWREEFHLRPYFWEWRKYKIVTIEQLARHRSEFAKTSTIHLVSSSFFVLTNHPSQKFGEIQVVSYPGTALDSRLRTIRDDLITTGDHKISATLAACYKAIYDINNSLSISEAQITYYDLWRKSSELTKRAMNKPLKLRIFEGAR